MSVNFTINGKAVSAAAEADTPLLWVIRDELGMTVAARRCAVRALCTSTARPCVLAKRRCPPWPVPR
jgi:aerobic-type carbon monoxide dehydrogenase small subunit (CoxS/CutS family)